MAFADGERRYAEEHNAARQEGHIAPEEQDHNDAAATTPSTLAPPDAFQGMFAPHGHMDWSWRRRLSRAWVDATAQTAL